MIVTAAVYDYGEQCFCACYASQTGMRILSPCWQSSCFQQRYIIKLFCSLDLIFWLVMLTGRLCLGEQATMIMKQGTSPYSLTAQTLELGLYNICSGVYKGSGVTLMHEF